MASLKEIKGRITSVRSTQKITSAMRMVSSAKLHHVQQVASNFHDYEDELLAIEKRIGSIASVPSNDSIKSIALIVISADTGLCGAFNSNIEKTTLSAIAAYQSQGVAVHVIPLGKKIAKSLIRNNIPFNADFQHLSAMTDQRLLSASCKDLVRHLLKEKNECHIDTAEVISHHFVSMGKQEVIHQRIELGTPFILSLQKKDLEFILEPSSHILLQKLFTKKLNAQLYGLILDSQTSEHASRMLAMQTADDNARELMQDLTLQYNKSRQQSITNELMDIMGGKIVNTN